MTLASFAFERLPRTGWRYRKRGWKYRLTQGYQTQVCVFPDAGLGTAEDPWISLSANGKILIREGYAWDGPSGPTIDTDTFMRGSLVHDALYQLMREGQLSPDWRLAADQELYRICIEDGMTPIRAWWVYWGVRIFAARHARPR